MKKLLIASAALLLEVAPALALNDTIGVTAGSGKTANLIKFVSNNVISEIGICDATTENQCATVDSGGRQLIAITSGSVASGAYASGSITDGAMVTLGTKADAATCATTNTVIACLRQIDTDVQAGIGATGSAVPAASIYPGFNVGGTLRGATAVNPSGTVYAQQHDVTSVNGVTVLTGTGATGTGAQRVTISIDQATNAGAALVKGGVSVVNGGSFYQHVAASQTAAVLQSSTGAAGDYLSHCVIYPSTTAAGSVTVFDNANAAATNVIEFTTGTLSNLAPIAIPVGAVSTAGAWKVTTGANETVVCYGKFS